MISHEKNKINYHPQLPIPNSNQHQNISAQQPFFDLGRALLSTYPLHAFADFAEGKIKLAIPAINPDDIIQIWQGTLDKVEVFDIEVSQSFPLMEEASLTNWDHTAYQEFEFEGGNIRDEVLVRIFKDNGGNPTLLASVNNEREDLYQSGNPQVEEPATIIQDTFASLEAAYLNHFSVEQSMNLIELELQNNTQKYELCYLDMDNVVVESLSCATDGNYLLIEIQEHINKELGNQAWRNMVFSIPDTLYANQDRVKIKRRNNQHQRTTKKKYTGHKINHSKQNMS
jgi:hypothetical protein